MDCSDCSCSSSSSSSTPPTRRTFHSNNDANADAFRLVEKFEYFNKYLQDNQESSLHPFYRPFGVNPWTDRRIRPMLNLIFEITKEYYLIFYTPNEEMKDGYLVSFLVELFPVIEFLLDALEEPNLPTSFANLFTEYWQRFPREKGEKWSNPIEAIIVDYANLRDKVYRYLKKRKHDLRGALDETMYNEPSRARLSVCESNNLAAASRAHNLALDTVFVKERVKKFNDDDFEEIYR